MAVISLSILYVAFYWYFYLQFIILKYCSYSLIFEYSNLLKMRRKEKKVEKFKGTFYTDVNGIKRYTALRIIGLDR